MRFTMRFVNNTLNEDIHTNKVFKGRYKTYSLGYSAPSYKSQDEIILDDLVVYSALK